MKYLYSRSFISFLALMTIIFILFEIVVTSTALLSISNRMVIHISVLILSLLLLIAYFWKETDGDFFSFINITLGWYIVMFVIPIFLILYIPRTSIKSNYWDIASFEYSVLIVIIALYSLAFGYKLARNSRNRIKLPLGPEPAINRIGIVIVICVFAALLYLLLKAYVARTGIFEFFRYHPRGSEYSKREYSMGIYTIINFLSQGLGYIFYLCFLLPRDKIRNKISILCANLFILFSIVDNCVVAIWRTEKSTVFGMIFFIAALINYRKRRIKVFGIIIIFVIGISILTAFNYRRVDVPHRVGFNRANIIPRMYTQTFDDFETLCVVTSHIPHDIPYYLGKILFGEIVYLPIPRALWQGKPMAYGSRLVMYDIKPAFFFSGYHTGLQSQFYADFGFPGVVIGFIAFGWLIGWVYNIFRHYSFNKGIVLFYIFIISNSWLYLKGGFPWLNLFIMTFLPFYIMLRYIYPVKIGFKT